jgi:hypothetical protein
MSKNAKVKKPVSRASALARPLSRSWPVSQWSEKASEIYPNTTAAAKYLVRAQRSSLLEHGAMVRVGRDLVIMGDRYERWLERQAANVPDYPIAPNRNLEAQP